MVPDNDPNLGVFSSQCPDGKFPPPDGATIHANEYDLTVDGVGVVFVSGEERETTANETGPAAISLSGVCDRPFAVPLFPGTFFFSYLIKVTDCQE